MWNIVLREISEMSQIRYSLLQVTPSPENPVLQLHVNEPSVLVQTASSWQLSVPSSHSLSSKEIEKTNTHALITLYSVPEFSCNYQHLCYNANEKIGQNFGECTHRFRLICFLKMLTPQRKYNALKRVGKYPLHQSRG